MNLQIGTIDDRAVARIDFGPGATLVFATQPKGDKNDVFLVRVNNSTLEIRGQEALDYQRKR